MGANHGQVSTFVERHRYALRIAYEGHAFRGYQRQPGMVTVQGCIEEALTHMGISARLEVAARTDAGVHAIDQVVTFASRDPIDLPELRATLNSRTPPELICLDAIRIPADIHARASARSRTYVYLLGWPPPPELARYSWTLPDARAFPDMSTPSPDLARAEAALSLVVGEHDFGGFARPGEQTARRRSEPRATVRRIISARIVSAPVRPLAAFVFEGHGFLRAMIRHLVGTVVSISLGYADPARVSEILEAPGVRYRGVRAPAWGLTLARVEYPTPLFPSPRRWGALGAPFA